MTESTNFPPEGLGPDFAQAFSDQPFQVTSTTEQQEQEESAFAQNTLVDTLTSGKYIYTESDVHQLHVTQLPLCIP